MMVRMRLIGAILLALCWASLVTSSSEESYVVDGIIKLQDLQLKAGNVKLFLNGGEKVTFPLRNGYFAFQGVPSGTHVIEISAPGYYFSPLRVDVSAKLHGLITVTAIETGRGLPEHFTWEPVRQEQYFEKREPFSILALLKSPMGLMVGFMLVAVFLLPKLMDSIDPEERKKIQEEMRNRPAPSFSNLLQGRT